MKLREYILKTNERRIAWLGRRAWIPNPTKPYSWARMLWVVLGFGLAGFVIGEIGLVVLPAVNGSDSNIDASRPLTFRLEWLNVATTEFAALSGISWALLSRSCWNRRVRMLALQTAGEANTATPSSSVSLRNSAIGFFYSILIFWLTPLLMFHAIEDVRGTLAYRRARARFEAAGECLDAACLQPTAVAETNNFFATPFWRQFRYQWVSNGTGHLNRGKAELGVGRHVQWEMGSGEHLPYLTNFHLPNEVTAKMSKASPKELPSDGRVHLDQVAAELWRLHTNPPPPRAEHDPKPIAFPMPAQPGLPAQDILQALGIFTPIYDELSAASRRPLSVYPLHFNESVGLLLPHLAAAKSIVLNYRLRALARMESGDIAGAFQDVQVQLRVGEAMRGQPVLIAQLVGFSIETFAIKTLWQGLVDHRWDDAQLAWFQQRMSQRDYATGFLNGLRGERVLGLVAGDQMLRPSGFLINLPFLKELTGGEDVGSASQNPSTVSERSMMLVVSALIPAGWVRLNQAVLLESYGRFMADVQNQLAPQHRDASWLASMFNVNKRPSSSRMEDRFSAFNMLQRLLMPALDRAASKADQAQTLAQMAALACALERHHKRHGEFPAALSELVPALMDSVPMDPMNGEPFHYVRTDDGWFRLWSVGLDRRDDGGIYQKIISSGGKNTSYSEVLDWPWPRPLTNNEARIF